MVFLSGMRYAYTFIVEVGSEGFEFASSFLLQKLRSNVMEFAYLVVRSLPIFTEDSDFPDLPGHCKIRDDMKERP